MTTKYMLGLVVVALTVSGCASDTSQTGVGLQMPGAPSHSEHSAHSGDGGHPAEHYGSTAQGGDEKIDHCVEVAKAATTLFTPGCFVCLCRLDHDITVACDTQCWALSKCVHQQCSAHPLDASALESCAAERCSEFYGAWAETLALRSITAQCPTLCLPKPPPPPAGAPAPAPAAMDAGS